MAPEDGPLVRRRSATLRFRITALATVVVLVVLLAAAAGLVLAQTRLLTENLEEGLSVSADAIEEALRADALPAVLTGVGDDDAIAQVIDGAGTVVAATANVAGAPPVIERSTLSTDALRTIAGPALVDDADVRVLARPVGTDLVVVGAGLGDVEESRTVLVASLTVAIPVVVVLLAALVWWLIGRALRPVEAIRAEVGAISASDLHRRVPQPPGDDEIARLARTMNAMLDRIEAAARRQQEFVADASHELRGPLTRMRTELEVDLAHPDGADPIATHRSVLTETAGLSALVEDLLHLARADAGADGAPRQDPVDLDDLVDRHARRVRAEGRVRVDASGITAAQVHGDAPQLSRAVANLIDNAARHARGTVTVTVGEHVAVAVVTVADDGAGIAPEDHERVFERFTRLDEARAGADGRTGLGLAIARDIARRHDGTLTIDANHRGGARFVLTVPTPPTR